jgi:hypothetical protein
MWSMTDSDRCGDQGACWERASIGRQSELLALDWQVSFKVTQFACCGRKESLMDPLPLSPMDLTLLWSLCWGFYCNDMVNLAGFPGF